MGVVADIGRSLRHGPVGVLREHLARGPNEARALAFLMLGCFLVWLGKWPLNARRVELQGEEFARLAAYDFLGLLIILPLVFYGLAALVHGISRLSGGRGTLASARLALFWSWLAATPIYLLAGLAGGFLGPQATNVLGVVWIVTFVAFWALSQREAARGPVADGV